MAYIASQGSGRDASTRPGTRAMAGRRSRQRPSGLEVYLDAGRPLAGRSSSMGLIERGAIRAIDILVSLFGLVALSPLMVGIALHVMAGSRGNPFFFQEREGLVGRPFRIVKFRTFHVCHCDSRGADPVRWDDPRITEVGRMLREKALDELPQLFNVLMGDMSLVGPRPHVPHMRAGAGLYRDICPTYDARLAVRPGLTGWAQIHGLTGPVHTERQAIARLDHDIAYVQNVSLALNLRILAMTPSRVWGRRAS
ncbi:sugar transferase [Pelagibacterium montanilacus]|uniref:sugar transferase n=1 Tax=Pelagibacterium montanilacus TaxID=2185280 RepID=UPI000F8F80E6|nr:sugar transferase [Pelagibacterium montanilacus]